MNRRRMIARSAAAVIAIDAIRTPDYDLWAEADAAPLPSLDGELQGVTDGDLWAQGYLAAIKDDHAEWERTNTEQAIVVGAIYSFMGYLTTRDTPITVSRSHEVYDILEAFTAWAENNGLDRNSADVMHWRDRLGVVEPDPSNG